MSIMRKKCKPPIIIVALSRDHYPMWQIDALKASVHEKTGATVYVLTGTSGIAVIP